MEVIERCGDEAEEIQGKDSDLEEEIELGEEGLEEGLELELEGGLQNKGEHVSKNQLKRQRRAEYLIEKRKQKRVAEKEKKRAAKRAKIGDVPPTRTSNEHNFYEGMTEEQIAQFRKERKEKKIQEFAMLCDSRFSVIIDCDWEQHHAEQPIKSLGQQISFCYGFNRRATNPVHLYITGMGPKLNAQLLKGHSDGWQNVVQTPKCYTELPEFFGGNPNESVLVTPSESVLVTPSESLNANSEAAVIVGQRQKELVYLTSDAEETLETLDPNCAYIIGGIVDRNRLKGITYAKAKAQGIRTARLPIKDYMTMSCTHVLTINHVFEILLLFEKTGSWQSTLEQVLPMRKEAKVKGTVDDSGDEPEKEDATVEEDEKIADIEN